MPGKACPSSQAGRPFPPGCTASPSIPVGGPSAVVAVREVIATLKPNHRLVLALRYSEGFSYKEIAESLDWPLGRVKATLHRARQAFKEEFSDSAGEK